MTESITEYEDHDHEQTAEYDEEYNDSLVDGQIRARGYVKGQGAPYDIVFRFASRIEEQFIQRIGMTHGETFSSQNGIFDLRAIQMVVEFNRIVF